MIRKVLAVFCILSVVQGGEAVAVAQKTQKAEQTKRVVLVGASIGKAWHFEDVGRRASLPGYRFDYAGAYRFDKGDLVQGLVQDADKPDVVMIKECSTYFPGDPDDYRKKVTAWVEQLRAAGIQPMLVTTAPVGEPSGLVAKAKLKVKKLLGKPTWLDSITSFNDWIKEYGRAEGIPVFDLEALLRRSAEERWLKPEFDSGDTVHLTEAAYREMDRGFARFLNEWAASPKS